MLTTAMYDEYIDPNIVGVNSIPRHWTVLPLCAVAKQKSVINCVGLELLSVYLDRGVIKFSDVNEKRTNATSEDLSKYQEVLPGDFVLNNQQAWRGSVGVSKYSGIVSPAYIVLVLSDVVNTKFANYFFRYEAMVSQYLICSRGVGTIQRNLYWPQLKRVPVFIPPFDEQDRIANFLDKKTAEIDAAIAKKQRLIELLKEQKAILINQAVTKGLNPDAPMRDSGVEWIGEVPEHWEVKRLKHLFFETSTRTKTGREELLSLRMYKGLIPHNDVSDKPITDAELVDYKLITPGQMVMNRMRASIGLFGFATSYGLVSPDYAVFNKHNEVDFEYFLALFKTDEMGSVFRLNSRGLGTGSSGFMRLYTDSFGKILVPFPSISEQMKIGQYLKEIHGSYLAAENKVNKEIQLLGEMKAITISEAVTGKIKL